MLLSRLKQLAEQKHHVDEQIEREIADEREITDEQIEIQAMLEAKAREREIAAQPHPPDYSPVEEPEPEALPIPAAMIHHEQHPGKRHGTNAVSSKSRAEQLAGADWSIRNRNLNRARNP
ncbi:integrin beta-ps [Lasius niger]|uniref:Integrin beta-ps n=1 Tax=Lasius niger TaxID=67767 RepID=A0A0J7K2E0_LASNI|nr:integrin beta-ps [Lasius niger]